MRRRISSGFFRSSRRKARRLSLASARWTGFAEGWFCRAVLAKQAEHSTAGNLEVDAVQCINVLPLPWVDRSSVVFLRLAKRKVLVMADNCSTVVIKS